MKFKNQAEKSDKKRYLPKLVKFKADILGHK